MKLCEAQKSWSMETFIDETFQEIQETVQDRNVLMFLSGGVDSSVAFAMLNKVLGQDRVLGLFINNGSSKLVKGNLLFPREESLRFYA